MFCLKITDSELAMYSVSWKCWNTKETLCSPQPSATPSVHWHNRSNQIFAEVEHETGKLQLANIFVGGNSQSGAIHGIILLSVSWGSVFWGLEMWGMEKVQLSLDCILNESMPSLLAFSSNHPHLHLCEVGVNALAYPFCVMFLLRVRAFHPFYCFLCCYGNGEVRPMLLVWLNVILIASINVLKSIQWRLKLML